MKDFYQKFLYFFILFSLPYLSLDAQQLPLFNQNRASLNPAYISSGYFKYNAPTFASIRYRHQWTKVKDAPRTLLATFSHLDEENSFSYGGDFISDETGPTGFIGVYGRANYGIQLTNELLLSFGLKGGATQYRVKGNELHFLNAGDLANNNVTKLYPDFSLGAMLYWQENYYIGFSVPQIFSLDLTFKDAPNEYNVQRVRHYYGIAGARFDLGSDSWLEGSVETRYVQNIPFYLNSEIAYEFRQIFWIGISGSTSKELGMSIGAIANVGSNSNLIKIGYNITNFFQSYGPNFGTVHEFGVHFYL